MQRPKTKSMYKHPRPFLSQLQELLLLLLLFGIHSDFIIGTILNNFNIIEPKFLLSHNIRNISILIVLIRKHLLSLLNLIKRKIESQYALCQAKERD